jgi:hypothetical protein
MILRRLCAINICFGGLLPVAGTDCYCCLLVQPNFWWLSKFNVATEKRTAKYLWEQKCGNHLFVAYFTSCIVACCLILLGNQLINNEQVMTEPNFAITCYQVKLQRFFFFLYSISFWSAIKYIARVCIYIDNVQFFIVFVATTHFFR